MAKKKVAKKKKPTKKKAAKAEKEVAEKETKTVKKKAAKRKTRSKKAAAEVRMKVYWGVFNHAMKRVALYEFNQKRAAQKRAKELSASGKPPHFVQKIKEAVQEQ